MSRDSRLTNALWVATLALIAAYAITNFARGPFGSSSGSAAMAPPQLTLWVPGPERGAEGMTVAREAAAELELEGRRVAVKGLPGGSSRGISGFLSRRSGRAPGLLVLTSSTLADIAHDRHENLVPGVAAEALLSGELLRRSHSVGVLAAEPLQIGVPASSPIRGPTGLLAMLRSEPGRLLVALSQDSYSRVALAGLLERSGTRGSIRFEVHESPAVAVDAAETGAANLVLAPRGAVLPDLRRERLRPLAWPVAGAAPRSWVALVAPPRIGPHLLGRLRRTVARVTVSPAWRRSQGRAGREIPRVGRLSRLGVPPSHALQRAEREETVAEIVESRG